MTRRTRPGAKDSDTAPSRAGLSEQARLQRLAAEQGVQPVTDPTVLLGGFWPEEESAEEFLTTLRAWREERPAPHQP